IMQIDYISTGRDLMPRPRPRPTAETAMLLADPDYDLEGKKGPGAAKRPGLPVTGGFRFQSLPGFGREADTVVRLLQETPRWKVRQARKADATEERLLAASRPRLLYLITHGFFLQDVERPREGSLLRDLELASAGGLRPVLPRFGADPRLRSG